MLSLCQTDWSEINGNTRGKWNNIFRLNWANQKEWLLPFFIPCPNSLIRAKNQSAKNGTANFSRNIPGYILVFNQDDFNTGAKENESLKEKGQRLEPN